MEEKEKESTSILHSFQQGQTALPIFTKRVILILTAVAVLGAGTGFLLSKSGGKIGFVTVGTGSKQSSKGVIVGSNDLKTFKDQVEGQLLEGGVDGEGQYHLKRPGGESQNVYLTSSIVDLSKFLKKKVRVWGETQRAQKAGWLMDVGRLEVLE